MVAADQQADQPAPPGGRERTDKSLHTERAKTDESLTAVTKAAERQADEAMSASRDEADELRSQTRIEADFTRDSSVACHEEVRQERLAADEALDVERSETDAVLDKERRKKVVVQNQLLRAERKETDDNLTSERKQTDEDARRAAAELMTRDEFLAMVSHDLRNPVGSISMIADLLNGHPRYASADQETRGYIDMIGRNAAEALRLIRDLIDMERMASGKLGLEVQNHDANELVQDTVASFNLQAAAKKVTLSARVPVGDLEVSCDRNRIKQVLSNLVHNAIKFSHEGGTVTVSSGLRDGAVEFSVTDNGPGIPIEVRDAIFGRLWQVRKNDGRGLGLGLYIAKTIVDAHHGQILVESTVGKGSSFRISLPTVIGLEEKIHS